MMYDLTNFTNASGMGDLMLFTNEVTHGGFVTMMVIAIFFVLLMIQKRYNMIDAMLSSAFICFVISALFAYGGLISFWIVVLFLSMLAFGMLYKHFE
jgi:hypothetical protein